MSARTRAAAPRIVDAKRTRGRAWLHQHAELGDEIAVRRRPRDERTPAGRDPGSDGRGLVDGAAQRRDEASSRSSARATSNIRSSGRRSANISNILSARESRRTSPRSSAPPPSRQHDLGEKDVDPTPAQLAADARPGSPGDEGGRAGCWLVAHLSAGDICRRPTSSWRSYRGRQMRRHVHQPHALRGRSAPGEHRRTDRRSRGVPALRPKSIISSRRASANWEQARPGDCEASRRLARRACGSPPTCTLTRRAERVSMQRCRPGSRRAATKRGSSASRIPRSARALISGNAHAVERLGKSLLLSAGPEGCFWSRSRTRS